METARYRSRLPLAQRVGTDSGQRQRIANEACAVCECGFAKSINFCLRNDWGE
ncbi:hypothetical protein C7S14_7289 [Burkholderia cepacia]|nr:hypothetical protein [Burkholderia cepacia]QOH36617.1 hypothetical protein C7S14_7289 [Burkholderia cepacia]